MSYGKLKLHSEKEVTFELQCTCDSCSPVCNCGTQKLQNLSSGSPVAAVWETPRIKCFHKAHVLGDSQKASTYDMLLKELWLPQSAKQVGRTRTSSGSTTHRLGVQRPLIRPSTEPEFSHLLLPCIEGVDFSISSQVRPSIFPFPSPASPPLSQLLTLYPSQHSKHNRAPLPGPGPMTLILFSLWKLPFPVPPSLIICSYSTGSPRLRPHLKGKAWAGSALSWARHILGLTAPEPTTGSPELLITTSAHPPAALPQGATLSIDVQFQA